MEASFYIGVTTLYHSYHHDTVYVFRADVKESDFKIDNIEISEANGSQQKIRREL